MDNEVSISEEKYLKAIYELQFELKQNATTNDLAERVKSKPPSVTDMIKKLAVKDLVIHKPYYGNSLTPKGKAIALNVIRRERLWETFLVKTLGFDWDEVMDIADQLRNVNSKALIDKLDDFLSNPRVDPLGQIIPDKNGQVIGKQHLLISDLRPGEKAIVVGCKRKDKKFLRYLKDISIYPGQIVKVVNYDISKNKTQIIVDRMSMEIDRQISQEVFVQKESKFNIFV